PLVGGLCRFWVLRPSSRAAHFVIRRCRTATTPHSPTHRVASYARLAAGCRRAAGESRPRRAPPFVTGSISSRRLSPSPRPDHTSGCAVSSSERISPTTGRYAHSPYGNTNGGPRRDHRN